MATNKTKASKANGGSRWLQRSVRPTRKYSSVEEMLRDEKFSEHIVRKFKLLLRRDDSIVRSFAAGCSMARLSHRHSLPLDKIEDIIRFEMIMRSRPNVQS